MNFLVSLPVTGNINPGRMASRVGVLREAVRRDSGDRSGGRPRPPIAPDRPRGRACAGHLHGVDGPTSRRSSRSSNSTQNADLDACDPKGVLYGKTSGPVLAPRSRHGHVLPVGESWSSHPPQSNRGRERHGIVAGGSPIQVGLEFVPVATAAALISVPVGLRPLFLHLLSQPEGGSLYVFGNGGPAQGERFADGIEKMADAEVHLSACCGGWPRPQFRCRSPEDVNSALFVIPCQRFLVHPVLLPRFVVLFLWL